MAHTRAGERGLARADTRLTADFVRRDDELSLARSEHSLQRAISPFRIAEGDEQPHNPLETGKTRPE